MQLGEHLRCEDILAKHTVVFFLTILITHTKIFLSIAGLGFLHHGTDIQHRTLLVFPDTMQDSIAAHLNQRYRMDADHQTVMQLIALDHLQGTGLVGVAAIERIAQ